MIQQVATREYEQRAYEIEIKSKTFRISEMTWGAWVVTSHNTKQPCAKYHWGCKSFPTLQAVEGHYKALRGLVALLDIPAVAA